MKIQGSQTLRVYWKLQGPFNSLEASSVHHSWRTSKLRYCGPCFTCTILNRTRDSQLVRRDASSGARRAGLVASCSATRTASQQSLHYS